MVTKWEEDKLKFKMWKIAVRRDNGRTVAEAFKNLPETPTRAEKRAAAVLPEFIDLGIIESAGPFFVSRVGGHRRFYSNPTPAAIDVLHYHHLGAKYEPGEINFEPTRGVGRPSASIF